MKDVILTTDLYHRHADPNDHWNLASMFSLALQKQIRFVGILCDDDRALTDDGSFKHFGDPSVQSIAQLNYITGMAVPVAFGSRKPIKSKADLDAVLRANKKISSVTLLLDALQRAENKVDIHMCGSCKDVVIAYYHAPELFAQKCDCIYLNAGTYEKQDPLEYNVSLEPYAFSRIFQIPCNIRWAPCFDALRPYPYVPAKRANYFEMEQWDMLPYMSESLKKYFNYMYGLVTGVGWLSYLRAPLDKALLETWAHDKRQMWSTPGFLLSADKCVDEQAQIKDCADVQTPLYTYRPVHVKVTDNGLVEWKDTTDSHIQMFENKDPALYQQQMPEVIKQLLDAFPKTDIDT